MQRTGRKILFVLGALQTCFLALAAGCQPNPEPGDYVVNVSGVPEGAVSVHAVIVRNTTSSDPRPAEWQDLTPGQNRFFLRFPPGTPALQQVRLRVLAKGPESECAIAYAEADLPATGQGSTIEIALKPEQPEQLCRMILPPQLWRIRALWGSSDNDIWGVGEPTGNSSTYFMHYNGMSWQPVDSPKPAGVLYALWGAAANDVWAAGNSGSLLRYDGSAWRALPPPNGTQSYSDIWGAGPKDIWFATNSPSLLHYDGNTFGNFSCPNNYRLWSLWGVKSTTTQIWASGFSNDTMGGIDNAGLVTSNGTNCTVSQTYSKFAARRIRGASATNILLAGAGSLETTYNVSGAAAQALRFTGTAWSGVILPSREYIRDIWAAPTTGEYWAVGESGVILHGTGATDWTAASNNSSDYIYSAWGSPAGYLWMGGDLFIQRLKR